MKATWTSWMRQAFIDALHSRKPSYSVVGSTHDATDDVADRISAAVRPVVASALENMPTPTPTKTKRQVYAEFDRLMLDCQNDYLLDLRDLQVEHCRREVALCVWRDKQIAGALDDELDSEKTVRGLVSSALKGVNVI